MAEAVIIEGFGSGAKEWATETTQKQVLATLQKIGKLTDAQVKAIKQQSNSKASSLFKNIKKDTDELDKSLKHFNSTTNQGAKANKENTKEVDKMAASFSKASKRILIATTGLIVSGISAIGYSMANQVNMYVDLNAAGMNLVSSTNGVADGLSTFGAAATLANLSFQELIDIQKEYGKVLGVFGVGRFAEYSKNFGKSMLELGFTAGEAAEYMGEYLEQQRFFSTEDFRKRRVNTAELEESTRVTSAFSKILGISRKQLQAEANERLKSSDTIVSFLAAQAARGAKTVQGSFDLMSKSLGAAADPLMDILAQRNILESEQMHKLMATAPELGNALLDIRRKIDNDLSLTVDDIRNVASAVTNEAKDIALSQGEWGQSTNRILVNLDQVNEGLRNYNEIKEKEDTELLAQSAALSNSWRQVTEFFDRTIVRLFGNATVLKAVADGIKALGEQLTPEKVAAFSQAMADLITKAVPKIVEFVDWIISLGEDASGGFSIAELVSKFITGAVVGVYAMKAIGSSIATGFVKLFSGGGLSSIFSTTLRALLGRAGVWAFVIAGIQEAFEFALSGNSFVDVLVKALTGFSMGVGDLLMSMLAKIADLAVGLLLPGHSMDTESGYSDSWNKTYNKGADAAKGMHVGSPTSKQNPTVQTPTRGPEVTTQSDKEPTTETDKNTQASTSEINSSRIIAQNKILIDQGAETVAFLKNISKSNQAMVS